MQKNMANMTKTTILFICWEVLFEIVFFLIFNFCEGFCEKITGSENIAKVIMIIPRVIMPILIIKFAIYNTLKKYYIEKEEEKQFFINICILFVAIIIINIIKKFNISYFIWSVINLIPLLFAKKYISEYNV